MGEHARVLLWVPSVEAFPEFKQNKSILQCSGKKMK